MIQATFSVTNFCHTVMAKSYFKALVVKSMSQLENPVKFISETCKVENTVNTAYCRRLTLIIPFLLPTDAAKKIFFASIHFQLEKISKAYPAPAV